MKLSKWKTEKDLSNSESETKPYYVFIFLDKFLKIFT